MKPAIPDIGTVIRCEGDKAVIRLKHEGSCKGCGAAAMGLCKGGLQQEVIVRNTLHAPVGAAVQIGLVQRVQYAGYVLAYVVPAFGLLFGMVLGHYLAEYAGSPVPDVLLGFLVMIGAAFFSLRRLKRLDSIKAIEIVRIFSGPWVPGCESEDLSLADHYLSSW